MTMDERSVSIRWAGHGRVYEGSWNDQSPITLDSDSAEGPSPTEALLMSVAACMAVDIQVILEKGRVPVDGLTVDVSGLRAPEPPRRFVSLDISIRVSGPAEGDQGKIERAAELSRDKYCSVFQTLRSDIEVRLTARRTG